MKMERVHIAHGHPKVSVIIEAHIENRAKIMIVANTIGNGDYCLTITNVDGPAAAMPQQ